MYASFVIIGGGIAGVSCAETLAFLHLGQKIILISESALIKTVTNLQAVTKILTKFDVHERECSFLSKAHANITVLHDTLIEINTYEATVITQLNKKIGYKYLCLCTGGTPKIIPQAQDNECVLGIRDTDSVEMLIDKLRKCKRIVIVGNGGIASELVYKIKNTEVFWVIKDKHVSATFVDPGASQFFQSALQKSQNEPIQKSPVKQMRYKEENVQAHGAALGPDWYKNFNIEGCNDGALPIKIMYQAEVIEIKTFKQPKEYPVEVKLSNNESILCDLVISATGVEAHLNCKISTEIDSSADGEIKVNEFMETSIPGIYAAGDVCSPNWPLAKHWFSMKLWTQARQMGCYAAKCMSAIFDGEEILQDFCFEIFTHCTRLFGYKVILLGLYNGQKLGNDYEILLRMTEGREYIKFVLQNGRLQGAILIGETDLEETCENLILNQLDLSPFGDDILNPDIDIEDYFD